MMPFVPDRRPQLQIVHGDAASPEEAAAVIAAVQRFVCDTAPPAVPARDGESQDPWQRAALLEQTGRRPNGPLGWGNTHPW